MCKVTYYVFNAFVLFKLEIISNKDRDSPYQLFSLQSKSTLRGRPSRLISSLVYIAILVRIVRMVICYLNHVITCFHYD